MSACDGPELQALFLNELTTRGEERLGVDNPREVEPDARIGPQLEHPVRILCSSGAHRLPGHIGGTLPRGLPGSAESHQDLNRRPGHM